MSTKHERVTWFFLCSKGDIQCLFSFFKIVAMVLRISDNIVHPCTLSMLNPCPLAWMGIIENIIALK